MPDYLFDEFMEYDFMTGGRKETPYSSPERIT